MAEHYIRRVSAFEPGASQKSNANTVRVDSSVEGLKFGTGSSGSAEKQVTVQGNVGLAAATLTLTQTAHDGQYIVVTVLSGSTITLPAATGSGATYKVIVGATLTSGSLVVKVASSSDYMRGFAYTVNGGVAATWATANTGTVSTESDTVTFNRTTTGLGTIGDYLEFVDFKANVWAVETEANASGTTATPFSASV